MFKVGDAIQLVHNAIITEVKGDNLKVHDTEKNLDFYIKGDGLLSTLKSAETNSSKKKCTKTEIVEVLLATHGGIFTVEFEKQDGTVRKLRGYLAKAEPLLGRSYCVDIDVNEQNKLRLVDHRTIHSLIFEKVYYYV